MYQITNLTTHPTLKCKTIGHFPISRVQKMDKTGLEPFLFRFGKMWHIQNTENYMTNERLNNFFLGNIQLHNTQNGVSSLSSFYNFLQEKNRYPIRIT